MKSSALKIKIVSNSILVAEMENNSDVQLRQENNTWWMISPKTGIHSINEPELNSRVQNHWNGFKINQNC